MQVLNPSPYGRGRVVAWYGPVSSRSQTPTHGVAKLRESQRTRLPLVVVGNGRSGTTWLAKALQVSGIDCPHECVGKDGTVSWYFTVDSDWHPYRALIAPKGRVMHVGERRSDFTFKHTAMLVREPLKMIGSMCTIMPKTEHLYVVDNSDGLYPREVFESRASRLLKTMFMANALWTIAEKQCDAVYRLEDLVDPRTQAWSTLLHRAGFAPRPLPDLAPKGASRGIYKARVITYDDMRAEDKKLADEIRRKAQRFGYRP